MELSDLKELELELVDRQVIHNNPPSWNWQSTIPDYCNLWICLSGTGIIEINKTPFGFAPGFGILLYPSDKIYAEKSNASSMKNIALHFKFRETNSTHRRLEHYRGTPAHLRSLSLVHEMTRYLASIPISARTEAKRWTEQILLIFAHDWELGPEDPQDRILREQIERIKEKPYGNVSIKQLAAEAKISLSQYRRRFVRLTQTQPNAFFLQHRIQSAQTLLIESVLNIDQIAQALGYRDTPFFSRQFKAKTGLTPTQFRAKYRPSEL